MSRKLHQRVCAICGKTDAFSKTATSPYSDLFIKSLANRSGTKLKFPESGYSHPQCVRKLQLKAREQEKIERLAHE